MNKHDLALFGGNPVRTTPFPRYNTMGQEEREAVLRVIDSGDLSKFMGAWTDGFYGGPEVRALEEEWAVEIGAERAVSVNSASSGLIVALGAAGVGPHDEVIVSPYSMCISATAPLFWGAVPVFCDVEPDTYCVDPAEMEALITPRTKAILAVDIFGQPADFDGIMEIADRHGLIVIEDAAQAPLAELHGKRAGTLGHIGVFSLNCHKHIHCGEGGIAVTNDERLAERMCLIRNHAEAAAGPRHETDLTNLVGYNMRMTELEASVARCQLRKLHPLVETRRSNCAATIEGLEALPGIRFGGIRENASHSFYLLPFLFDEIRAEVGRERFLEAVRAELAPTRGREKEGVKIYGGYVQPIYWLPIFQQRMALGRNGFPFADSGVGYERGLCPTVERLHLKELFCSDLMHAAMAATDVEDVVTAFHKVWEGRSFLK
ncbi:DegT/DnrJ/EryC1/StrS family aminotransferase [Pseudodesulfovibrio tunisiensis]|uniref:DegT/DnrJ/EryC1/StrS family aminotransferase n=1 Tax=Pseudodesulfovibrio tunisiensis TaxID=463192 RepID=UPI001FB34565|nr:DegT/DnrJ/EryC1/StrS family aminotransferase [Pseudodesulfovibrio tunisiensis]